MSSHTYRNRSVALAFGETLRAARQAQGVSQDQLADRCNVHRTYPSLLERGLRHPTLSMILRLADGLSLDPAQLVVSTVARLTGKLVTGGAE